MTIHFWENGTKVVDDLGFEGRIKVTRRERQLLSDGKQLYLDVVGSDGLYRNKEVSRLTEVVEPVPLDNSGYYMDELQKAGQNLNGDMTLKVMGDNGESNWININDQSIDSIVEFLTELKIIT